MVLQDSSVDEWAEQVCEGVASSSDHGLGSDLIAVQEGSILKDAFLAAAAAAADFSVLPHVCPFMQARR